MNTKTEYPVDKEPIIPIHLSTPSRIPHIKEYLNYAFELLDDLRKENLTSNLRKTVDLCKELWNAVDELEIEIENIRKMIGK